MKIYAVIDTNVIISALLSRHQDTAIVKTLDHLYDRTIIPVYNDEILEEYADVLQRPKFNFPDNVIKTTLEAIRKGGLNSDRIHYIQPLAILIKFITFVYQLVTSLSSFLNITIALPIHYQNEIPK